MRTRILLAITGLVAAGIAWGADTAPAARPADGEAVFRRVCANCHLGITQMGAAATVDSGPGLAAHAVPREFLRQYPPEAILNALTNGKMQAQGATLTPEERHAVAEFAANRPFGAAKAIDPALEAGKACSDGLAMRDPATGPGWLSWGNGITNDRYQGQARGGLTAADLPRLKVKWVFGYANVSSARVAPAVAGGRVFVASENGQVHALNAKSGCSYWTFKAGAGIATSPAVGDYTQPDGKKGHAVFFGDRRSTAYAVDAENGKLLWQAKVDTHPSASLTGSPTYYDGRVFVPVQGIGEESTGGHAGYSCCTFRGSVSAFDTTTGKLLWKTYTVGENHPRGKNKEGVQMYGPAGGGIWSAPTVDAKRGLVYVATGNGYADPPQPTTDAVIALDIKTGAVKWVRQALAGDQWAMGCDQHANGNAACPDTLGPDYDFSAPPAIAKVGTREVLVLPQKSGLVYALDPDDQGRILWQYRIGKGSGLGGQWGGAIENGQAYFGTGDFLTPTPGGVHAVKLSDGSRAWHMPPPQPICGERLGCSVSQGGALTAIPGAVLSGALDGGLRAYATKDGTLLWTFDTTQEFKTVNGIAGHGGGIDGPGPVVAGGMIYVGSGVGGFTGQSGNVLIAFGLD